MKPNTTREYYYTGDLYPYIIVTSPDGTVTTRQYNVVPEVVPLSLSVTLLGQLAIESPAKMQLNAYLKNIKDRNGEEIYTNGKWQIVQTAPLLGPLGIKSGYQYRADLIEGEI